MKQDQVLREQLIKLLQGGQAYQPLKELLKDITVAEAGKTVPELPYTLWQLLEHMRITLSDILDFSQNPDYKYLKWPDEYWTKEKAPESQAVLDAGIKAILNGLETLIALVQDPKQDLYKPFAHGEGQNLLREVLLVAEHNAYHTGEIIVIRRLLGTWK